ncbi:MAG TPA: DMT family transporter [Terriglobales bacterium]
MAATYATLIWHNQNNKHCQIPLRPAMGWVHPVKSKAMSPSEDLQNVPLETPADLQTGIPQSLEDREHRSSLEHHKHPTRLLFKTRLLILVIVIFGPLGNVMLGKGMKRIGTETSWAIGDLLHTLTRILSSGYIWLGVASLLTFFVAYLLVLTWADYSYVQPASAISYAVVALLSYFLLGEIISPLRLAGIAVICLGVFVVGRTHSHTAERKSH